LPTILEVLPFGDLQGAFATFPVLPVEPQEMLPVMIPPQPLE